MLTDRTVLLKWDTASKVPQGFLLCTLFFPHSFYSVPLGSDFQNVISCFCNEAYMKAVLPSCCFQLVFNVNNIKLIIKFVIIDRFSAKLGHLAFSEQVVEKKTCGFTLDFYQSLVL